MLGMCDLPENVLCDINPCALLPAQNNGTGDAPSPIICNDFYICHAGQLFQPDPIRCLPGTLFDSQMFQCTLTANAVCFPGSIPV
jgi:Chitin binding Peritrophin-A domain